MKQFRTWSLCPAVLAIALSGATSDANAACMYNGILYAKTTVPQEFRDSSLVIEGKVLSNRFIEAHDADEDVGYLSRIKVKHAFKGSVRPTVAYYTRLGTASFQLDAGKDYLLFLDRNVGTDWAKDAPGTMVINYDCGQSRPWAEVTPAERKQLDSLAAARAAHGR